MIEANTKELRFHSTGFSSKVISMIAVCNVGETPVRYPQRYRSRLGFFGDIGNSWVPVGGQRYIVARMSVSETTTLQWSLKGRLQSGESCVCAATCQFGSANVDYGRCSDGV